jgi:RHS repeat-associated protein
LAGGGLGGDGSRAREASLTTPADVALAADGRMFIADPFDHRIRVVSPEGIISTFAGNGEPCTSDEEIPLPIVTDPAKSDGACGDGGAATAANLTEPEGVAVGPDGSVYVADTGAGCVRRVAPNGIISTFAGICEAEPPPPPPTLRSPPDKDFPAGAAPVLLTRPADVAVAPDGGVYIADRSERVVYHVAPDGTVATVAGGGVATGSDGDRAVDVLLGTPTGIALGPNGDLFIAEQSAGLVRRVGVDGRIFTVAGTGFDGELGDGGRAVEAKLINPWKVAVGRDGNVYLSELFNARIRRVSPGGTISTAVGDGGFGSPREGGLATGVSLGTPGGLELSPDGRLVFTDHTSTAVYEAGLALQGFAEDEIVIADESGAQVFVFDAAGRHLRTVHALTGADLLRFRYDDSGLLEEIENGDGLITRIERSADGEPTTIVAPFGQETDLSLDPNGYLASVGNPADETRTFSYDGLGRLTAWTDALQAETTAVYDTLGRLRRETDPEGGFKQLDRSSVDRLTTAVTLTTAEGRTTRYETRRDQFSTRSTIHKPNGLAHTRTTFADGTSVLTGPNDTRVTSKEVPDPRFGMQAPLASVNSVLTPGGVMMEVARDSEVVLEDPGQPLSLAMLRETLSIGGRKYLLEYTSHDRRFLFTSPEGRQATGAIDENGRLLTARLGGLAETSFEYDSNGRLITKSIGEGSEQRTTRIEYDQQGRIEQLTDPLMGTVSFRYDSAGRVIHQQLPGGSPVQYSYNPNGDLTSLTPPGRSAHEFVYTSLGAVDRYIPPPPATSGGETSYAYDLDQRLTRLLQPNGGSIEPLYDASGRLKSLTAPGTVLNYTYDENTGLLTAITTSDESIVYTYDGPLITGASWSGTISGSVGRTFNGDLRVASTSVNGANTIDFGYDLDGFLLRAGELAIERDSDRGLPEATSLGGMSTSREYNSFGELERLSASHLGNPVYTVSYARDRLGRILSKSETIGGTSVVTQYSYDPAGRLQVVTRNGVVTGQYQYDSNGNRLAYQGSLGEVEAVYDEQDRLVDYGGVGYDYTAEGCLRLKSEGGAATEYEYDSLGRLKRVELANGLEVQYVIDPRGRRVGQKINGSLARGFLYEDDLNIVAELDGGGEVVSRFVYGMQPNVPDYMLREGRTYSIISDHLGSPRLVIDVETAAVLQRIDYDEFGRVILDTNPGFQPFGFAGGIYDHQTGLLRYGARDYDPEVGRWTSKDPILFRSGTANLYSYALGDPINNVDPTGLFVGSAFCKLLQGPLGKTAQEAALHGKVVDSLISAALGGSQAAGLIDSDSISDAVGFGLDALQVWGGVQTFAIANGVVGGGPAALGLSFLAGVEVGLAFNDAYERLSGQSLGADLVDLYWRLRYGEDAATIPQDFGGASTEEKECVREECV